MLGKIIRGLLIVVVLLGAVFFIGAQFLPAETRVTRTVRIEAPAEKIWPYISDFNKFQEWSPWARIDPDMTLDVAGEPGMVGHLQKWSSADSNVGSGSQEIIATQFGESVTTDLDFGAQGEAQAMLIIDGQGDASTVTWAFEADLDSTMMRWMGLVFDSMLGPQYETGLANLKAIVER